MRTVVIGGGAAGMAAAICAAEMGDETRLLERMDRVGKKLLATGNGRCNLMNTGNPCYPGGEVFAKQVLSYCGLQKQTMFWNHLGLRLREEEGGRVYPVSGQASTVLDVLRFAMERQQVDARTGVQVSALRREHGRFLIQAGNESISADRVIVTTGGQAQPKLGSNGSGYALLTDFGHKMTNVRPSLTQIETDTRPIAGLSGIRVRCEVSVHRDNHLIHSEQGELLFTDYGVSGVCVMQCARFVKPGDTLCLHLLPAFGLSSERDACQALIARREQWLPYPLPGLLTGLCVPRLALALLKGAHLDSKRSISTLTQTEIRRIAALIACFPLHVTGIKGFENAQVTAGGIATADFDPATLASTRTPGLHAGGEVLDVDGTCGGFNLMFAFGSGILAGLNGRRPDWWAK